MWLVLVFRRVQCLSLNAPFAPSWRVTFPVWRGKVFQWRVLRISRWPRRKRFESVFSGRVSPEKRRRRGQRLEFSAVSVAIPEGTLLCWARGSVATPQTSVAKRGRLSRNAPRAGRGGPAKAIFLWSRAGACPAAEKGAGGD